jgi:hypothetical protein
LRQAADGIVGVFNYFEDGRRGNALNGFHNSYVSHIEEPRI